MLYYTSFFELFARILTIFDYNHAMSKRALFLDRDGVINVDKHYVYKSTDFEFCEGIFELCQFFLEKKFQIFVITNQSGIARGYYSEEDFAKLSSFMLEKFLEKNIIITKIYHCPHLENCECRKPKPGMILKALEEFRLDATQSLLIGDNITDIEAGFKAGLKELCLVGANSHLAGKIYSEKNEEILYKKFANLDEITSYFKEKI